ncbi:chemotaxis protein CheA [Acidovorax sp. ACV01]|uniref:chemotaxis protein CheA n=1 Tax=Acidovorax sp. ACV01 TaxID=2769311 RepID=UPI00177C4348|nr:chemotaxis protein CheA [Acidovorax sp. ACV01]MBD9391470.1 chemotaxis protein CheA [Acidovorax sp. ACV01]
MGLNLKDALQTFFAEARTLLHDMEDALLRLETTVDDADALNAVFRAAHTIKGSAGLFGLNGIVAFTHEAESVLDLARAGRLPVDEQLCGLLLLCKDHMEQLLHAVESCEELAANALQHGDLLIARLQRLHGAHADGGAQTSSAPAAVGQPQSHGASSADGVGNADGATGKPLGSDCWHISLRFDTEVLRHGMDPASFIRYLGTFGSIVHVVAVLDGLPPLAELDPECCHIGFELQFRSDCDKDAIEAAFEFVREDCQLRILPPGSRVADYIRLIQELPEDKVRLGELLVSSGAVTQREVQEALQGQEQHTRLRAPLGQILIDEQVVRPEVVDAALNRQNEVRARQSQEAMFIRVHANKLDSLINQVGELVIAGAGAGLLAQRSKDAALLEAMSLMSRLVEDVRDGAMRLRMVEIGETFSRFRRVVRDVSKELGKDITLTISGADTELDKSVVERIGDPLTHLLRNAMDHGIEAADVRTARGKPANATVALKAYHEGGSVVIEVADDGGGLDRERILAKAVARGLVPADRELGDGAVWNLVFEPGFSTAEQVSNLSGRGVGMDVVKRGIDALRGSIEIESRAGQGATFRIRLPLTMAIIDGFLMAVGDTHFVVPLDAVLECVEIQHTTADTDRDYVDLRGEVLPLLRLRQHFGVPGTPSRRQNIVVVHMGARKAGLVVDVLRGEFQAVLKPMGQLFSHVHGLAGSTILGSGEVALMLDVPALLDQAAQAKGGGAWRPSEVTH